MADLFLGQMKDIILGQDFLTWLWCRSEVQNGDFELPTGRRIALFLERRITVQGGEGDSLETATVSGQMSELKEAKLGLATGKKVNKALIRIEHDIDTWQATLRAEDFAFSGLKTPAIESGNDEGDDPDAKFLEKIYLMERFFETIDLLYKQFLELRLSSNWESEIQSIRKWIASD